MIKCFWANPGLNLKSIRKEMVGNSVLGHNPENTFRAFNRHQNLEAETGIYMLCKYIMRGGNVR